MFGILNRRWRAIWPASSRGDTWWKRNQSINQFNSPIQHNAQLTIKHIIKSTIHLCKQVLVRAIWPIPANALLPIPIIFKWYYELNQSITSVNTNNEVEHSACLARLNTHHPACLARLIRYWHNRNSSWSSKHMRTWTALNQSRFHMIGAVPYGPSQECCQWYILS